MTANQGRETLSIYEWLCCPDCGSRDVTRGPRRESGDVELRCEDCGTHGWVGL